MLSVHGVRPVGVPVDNEGMRLDLLEQAIQQHRPRFLYTVASYQNPTGVCLSPARRKDLLTLAARYQLPIIEDDLYGFLAYDDDQPVSLKAMDQHGLVFY